MKALRAGDRVAVSKRPKPRSTICWSCGKALYQRRVFAERVIDRHPRILHKACAESFDKGFDDEPLDEEE